MSDLFPSLQKSCSGLQMNGENKTSLIFTLYVLKKIWISDDNPYKLKLKLDFLFSYTTILQLPLKTLKFY